MTKNKKIDMNRSEELAKIDDELDSALAKLSETTERIDAVLSEETANPAPEADDGAAVAESAAEITTDDSDDTPDEDAKA